MAMKRILADLGEIQQDVYSNDGIYYAQTDDNMKYGWACIFGPAGTPYEDCPMLYEFQLPDSYPFDPPKVLFRTFDGYTRFHPNMYVDGKCCLSILGTWDGPRWSSALRLSAVLVTMQSLMTDNPITNEPSYDKYSKEAGSPYAAVVEAACMQYILKNAEEFVSTGRLEGPLHRFQEQWLERLPNICARLRDRLRTAVQDKGAEHHYKNIPYAMDRLVSYKDMLERSEKLMEALHKTPSH
jgi:ubiquitin-protein ligase